ncbi:MAG: phosphoglucomutase/phosphomannomutase family protein [Bacteroidota bacterium]
MTKIKFGTDGWRAIIAKEYTTHNVARVAEATAKWMIGKGMKKVVIGYDCRFGGAMFTDVATQVFGKHGLHVVRSTGFVSTPMISLTVVKTSSDMGVVITASHNPPSYNGYKLKSAYGGPTIPKDIQEVEDMIADIPPEDLPSIDQMEQDGNITTIDMEQMYMDHVEENFDLELIRNSGVNLAYDAMYGAGQNVIKRLFPNAHLLHCDLNPSFRGQAPEPIARNLKQIAEDLASSDTLNLGLANDGDADRIGMFDGDGNFVDSHHILLLLLYYLYEHKNMRGKVVVTFSVTDKMRKLAELYGLDFEVTKIGFKYIAEIMTKEEIIVGGEESGGLAVMGHIPERDGIWIGLVIMEFMAKTGKSINDLIQDIYNKVGPFATDRDDLHIDNDKKWAIMDMCKNGEITKIGDRAVIRTESVDGYKFYLSEDDWVMIRPSGTEPVLRVYSQSSDAAGTRALLDATHQTLK